MDQRTGIEGLREIDRLAADINLRLDAMYAKLGKVVVAIETVNAAMEDLLTPGQLDRLLEAACLPPAAARPLTETAAPDPSRDG